eukprot:PhM_4_TR3199/c0_g2_i1/m.8046/K14539/LSG1; large subunit GTPase 1
MSYKSKPRTDGLGAAFKKKPIRRAAIPTDMLVNETLPAEDAIKDATPNLQSVWQCTDIANFFETAEQYQKDFSASRDVRLVHMPTKYRQAPIATQVVRENTTKPMTDSRSPGDFFAMSEGLLSIPRRPPWDYSLSKELVEAREKAAFTAWRRKLAAIEAKAKLVTAPYERNLEVWRQLWRVVERADVLFQIVDARNPMRFRCVDFERYVSEVKPRSGTHKKRAVLLLNKADLLTQHQRDEWASYLQSIGIPFMFFSALTAVEDRQKQLREHDGVLPDDEPVPETSHARHLQVRKDRRLRGCVQPERIEDVPDWVVARAASGAEMPRPQKATLPDEEKQEAPPTKTELARDERIRAVPAKQQSQAFCTSRVYGASELVDVMVALRLQLGCEEGRPVTVGFVGYPNVGKSCTINAIMGTKKVTVSATPGKTKHMQTLDVPNERRVRLVDCPGLVFPSFCSTTEDLVCDGVLPIAHMKDFILPCTVVCQRIPRRVLEAAYNVSLDPEDDIDHSDTIADVLLNAIARRRGFNGDHDQPNRSRAALQLLRDYVAGKIVFVHPPPNYHPDGAKAEEGKEDAKEEDGEPAADDDGEEEEDSASGSSSGFESDDSSEGEHKSFMTQFYAPTTVDYPWALELRRREETFNRGVNNHIVEARDAIMEKRHNARLARQEQRQVNEGDLLIEDADGEVALAVDAEDGIVCMEEEVPEEEAQAEAKLSKRQQRRGAKMTGGRKHKVAV